MARKSSSLLTLVLITLMLVMFDGKPSYGQGQQTVSATLSGTVTDPAGLAIKDAKVTLTSASVGIHRTYTTVSSGLYSFTFLPGDAYTLDVDVAGFKHYRQEGITLVGGQSAEQNVHLTVGATTETVEVVSQAPLLDTDNSNISSDISAKQLVDLPLNFRSVISLAMLNSSVSNTAEFQIVGGNGMSGTADQDVSFLNFGGTFFDTAEYLLDGTWDTRADWGGVVYVPSVDDVQEFRIQTNAFTAQYGWSSGNVINIETKSGSNQIHGDAYEFYGNSALFAKNYFNNGPEPAFNRNQFGVTLGGAIQKNKTFFFLSYEGLRQSTPATQPLETVPTPGERTGDFSASLGAQTGTDYLGRPIFAGEIFNPFTTRQVTCGGVDTVTGDSVGNCPAGATTEEIRDPISGNISTGLGVTNIIPTTLLDTIAKGIAAGPYWPTPTTSGLVNNFSANGSAPEHSNEYSVRVDHNFNDNNRMFARWSQKYQTKTNTPTFFGASDVGGPGLTNPNNRYSVDVGYSRILSPTFTMSANLGVNRHVEGGQTQGFGFQSSTLGLPSFVDSIAPAYPEIVASSYANLGATGGNNNYTAPQTLWTGSLDFTKQLGKHQLQFGFMDVWLRLDGGHYGVTNLNFSNAATAGPDPLNSVSTGDGFASFLLGVGMGGPCGGCDANSTSFQAFQAEDKQFLGGYLQDDWKITPKLTLSPGLRYEVQTAPTERNNNQENFNFTAANPINVPGFPVPGEVVFSTSGDRGLYHTTYTNFAPRIGVGYQMSDKLVLRGGYGIFFVPNYYGQGPNDGFSQTTGWDTSNNNNLNPSATLSGNANANCGEPPAVVPCPAGFSIERAPTGNSAGGLQDVGFSANAPNPIRPSPYVEQWMTGIQYGFNSNSLLDISYVGNHGVHQLYSGIPLDTLPARDLAMGPALNQQVVNPFFGHITSSSCGLNNPTVSAEQLLLPFPEFCGVNGNEPALGTSSYDALEATYKYRWHSGLDLNVSYTYSKFIDNVQGQSGWAFPGAANNYENPYNLAAERSVDVTNTPHSLVVNYDYELPFGRSKQFGKGWNRGVDAVLGGWQWTGILTAKSGLPIALGDDNNNVQSNGGAQRPNLVPGVSLVPQNQSITNWINPAALAQPAAFTFGDAPRVLSDFHGPRYFNWDMAIEKSWRFTESKYFQFRFEMFNALNHPDFFQPDANLGDGNFGKIGASYPSRSVQLAGKFYW
jgi:Carboxypeptidase regulatory-like domain/TonB dependent receptor